MTPDARRPSDSTARTSMPPDDEHATPLEAVDESLSNSRPGDVADEAIEFDVEFADWAPLEPELHEQQISGLLAWARRRRQTVQQAAAMGKQTERRVTIVDLGCGNGRALVPMVLDGDCSAIGIDDDPDAIAACRTVLIDEGLPEDQIVVLHHPSVEPIATDSADAPVEALPTNGSSDPRFVEMLREHIKSSNRARVVLVQGDMHSVMRDLAAAGRSDAIEGKGSATSIAAVDAVLCVGYTWMLIATPAEGLRLAQLIRQILAESAPLPDDREPPAFLIDDIPAEFWPRLIDGDWISGVSDDGQSQLAWDRADNVFVLREGDDVDPDEEQPRSGETRFRLWTAGELDLIAHVAGFRAPVTNPPHHLLMLSPAPRRR